MTRTEFDWCRPFDGSALQRLINFECCLIGLTFADFYTNVFLTLPWRTSLHLKLPLPYPTLPYPSLPYPPLPCPTLPLPSPCVLTCVPPANPLSAVQHLLAAKYLIELMGGPRHPELVTVYFRLVGMIVFFFNCLVPVYLKLKSADRGLAYSVTHTQAHTRTHRHTDTHLGVCTHTHTPSVSHTYTWSLSFPPVLYRHLWRVRRVRDRSTVPWNGKTS